MTEAPEPLDAAMRERVAGVLREALSTTLTSYHALVAQEVKGGLKEFTAHHTAARVAIGHLQLLIKLAEWANLETRTPDSELADLLTEAMAEVGHE